MHTERIIELQKSLRLAKLALEKIKAGTRYPESVAEEALDLIWPLEPKQSLQGLVRHDRRSRQ